MLYERAVIVDCSGTQTDRMGSQGDFVMTMFCCLHSVTYCEWSGLRCKVSFGPFSLSQLTNPSCFTKDCLECKRYGCRYNILLYKDFQNPIN